MRSKSQLMLESLVPNPVSKRCDTAAAEMKAGSGELVSDKPEGGGAHSADAAWHPVG